MKPLIATMVLATLAGCAATDRRHGRDMSTSNPHEHAERAGNRAEPADVPAADHARLHHYAPASGDPAWLVKAAEFHGHIGPWVAIGAMIGEESLRRLGSRGQWEIEVICWMPPDRQRPPFSCILDGLQSASGATMGKQNIRMDFCPSVVTGDQPMVYVFERGRDGHATRGYRFGIGDRLAGILARSRPEIIEPISREIAAHAPDDLLVIEPLSPADLARLGSAPSGSSGAARTH